MKLSWQLGLVASSAVALVVVGCGGGAGMSSNPPLDPQKLNVMAVSSDPKVDGDPTDEQWASAQPLVIKLGEGMALKDCNQCHLLNSTTTVTLRAVFTSNRITFLAQWPDPTASLTCENSFHWKNNLWVKSGVNQDEDRMAFFFPIGDIKGDDFNTGGCMTKCHVTDKHTDGSCTEQCHMRRRLKLAPGMHDEVYLASGRADMWQAEMARTAATASVNAQNVTTDPNTHEITGGTIVLTGYASDEYVRDYYDNVLGGRAMDDGTSANYENITANKLRPLFMKKAPKDFADAMFITQDDIDQGRCVGDAVNGVSASDANTYWPNYAALGAVVPERILRKPTGSMADIQAAATWRNGVWTVEISRPLNTGHPDDVQFQVGKPYFFGIATMDNCGGWYHKPSGKRVMVLYR